MYDLVYSHLIGSSERRDTILRILDQLVIARTMPSDVDILGTPANSSSPTRLASILGLTHDQLGRAVADVHLMLELSHYPGIRRGFFGEFFRQDQDIKFRHASFLEFLLDQSRSRELFVDIEKARLTLRKAYIRYIFNIEGM